MKGGGGLDFDGIYEAYFRDVFLYIKSFSADDHTAEEITQEAFVKALKFIGSFDGSKDIRAWLFTIAKNTYFTYCKRKKLFADLPEDISETSLPDQAPLFTEHIADEESAFLICKYLHSMSEPYKEVFSLRVFGELSFEKIAAIFSKSPGWARVTFYRAKKQIIEYMEEIDNE